MKKLLLILCLPSVALAQSFNMTADTNLHKVRKAPTSANQAADYDFSDVVVIGLAGSGGVGTVTSITATSPIVVTPSPLVSTGVISLDTSGLVSDTAYNATSWDAVTTVAPSKNAVRDKFESLTDPTTLISDTAYNATTWDAVTTIAPSKNAVRDQFEAEPSATRTFTNKRITKRSTSVSNTTSWSINTDNFDYADDTGLTGTVTIDTTGTPTVGQTLWISVTGTAARTISWDASDFESSTVTLPTTTVSTSRLDIGFVWNPVSSKWRCVASQ
jgi:hypothetical protein